ncbi:unnamed protein product [Rhizophagus irregularis]|nr:unnamed protein product [Rhizophagus irregularis]
MSFAKKTRMRTKVHCFCNKCNGALVDPRTRSKHRSINYKEDGPSGLLPDNDEIGDNEIEINYQEADEMDYNAIEYEPLSELSSDIPGPLPEEDDDYEEINFTSPEFDNDETKLPPNFNNDVCTWIMLWILQYQQRYKLLNVAINSLFKFLNLLLSALDKSKFSSFPSSIYMAKKKWGYQQYPNLLLVINVINYMTLMK